MWGWNLPSCRNWDISVQELVFSLVLLCRQEWLYNWLDQGAFNISQLSWGSLGSGHFSPIELHGILPLVFKEPIINSYRQYIHSCTGVNLGLYVGTTRNYQVSINLFLLSQIIKQWVYYILSIIFGFCFTEFFTTCGGLATACPGAADSPVNCMSLVVLQFVLECFSVSFVVFDLLWPVVTISDPSLCYLCVLSGAALFALGVIPTTTVTPSFQDHIFHLLWHSIGGLGCWSIYFPEACLHGFPASYHLNMLGQEWDPYP